MSVCMIIENNNESVLSHFQRLADNRTHHGCPHPQRPPLRPLRIEVRNQRCQKS